MSPRHHCVSVSGHPKAAAIGPQLLTTIFKHHQPLPPPNLNYEYRDVTLTSMDAIIAFSHVCKSWRRASLTSPTLWTNINLYHKAADTFLARSADEFLRLYLFDSGPLYLHDSEPVIVSQARSLSLRDGKRVRELVLRTDNNNMEDITDRLGPMLPELILALLHVEPTDTGDVFVFDASNVLTPKLRVLRAFNIDISQSLDISNDEVPGQLSDLTFLEVSDTHTELYTAKDIIQLILRCPSLEFLHINEQIGSAELVPLSEDVVVTLDLLKGLYLRDFHYAKLIFQHIRIPAHAPLLQEVDSEGESNIWGDSVLAVDYPNKVIKFGRGIYMNHRKPHFLAYLDGVPNVAQMASLIPMLGTTFDLRKIFKLTIRCPSDQDENFSTWRQLFFHLPLLQSLRMLADKACVNNVLTALWTSPTPCPKLENLYLKWDPNINELDWLEGLFDLRSSSGLALLKNVIVKVPPSRYCKEDFVRWAESVEIDNEISVGWLTTPA